MNSERIKSIIIDLQKDRDDIDDVITRLRRIGRIDITKDHKSLVVLDDKVDTKPTTKRKPMTFHKKRVHCQRAGCGTAFLAKRPSRALWCSRSCKEMVRRGALTIKEQAKANGEVGNSTTTTTTKPFPLKGLKHPVKKWTSCIYPGCSNTIAARYLSKATGLPVAKFCSKKHADMYRHIKKSGKLTLPQSVVNNKPVVLVPGDSIHVGS